MKRIILVLLIGIISINLYAQEDTTQIGPKIKEIKKDSVIYSSGFEYIDTIFYEFYNPNKWYYSDWITTHNGDTVITIQKRISDEGIQQQRTIKSIS